MNCMYFGQCHDVMSAVAVMCATAHSSYRITPPAHRFRPVDCSMTVGRSHSCRILLLPTLAAALARCSCRDLCLRGLAGWAVCSFRSLGAAVGRQSDARSLPLLIYQRRHCRIAQCGRCCYCGRLLLIAHSSRPPSIAALRPRPARQLQRTAAASGISCSDSATYKSSKVARSLALCNTAVPFRLVLLLARC